MKYSVLMSVFQKDNPVFLKLALESIYDRQTRKPDEIVVVFDGPLTTELYAVLDEFRCGKENIVFYFPQSENKGLGEALRIGSLHCTGDYIFRMDSDDISHERRFEEQSAYIEMHPDVDVLGTDIAEFEHDLDETMRVRRCPAGHDAILKMGKKRSPMNHVSVCIKRTALDASGGYETLLYVEDYYLWLKMIAAGCRFANIHDSLVYVRIGTEFSAKRGAERRVRNWWKLQKFMLAHKMVNVVQAAINMVCIAGFIYCPDSVRKFAYDKLLRKQGECGVGSIELKSPAERF